MEQEGQRNKADFFGPDNGVAGDGNGCLSYCSGR